ncbi:MAG: ABC transporter transmembrane domain-containing protein [Opitutaceae bacterium]|nr:ABC transporter transmembrane domain-containing protein [Opitutaceae bacterium]
MPDFKQHDATDCGAACLAYVFHKYGLAMSFSAIRQRTGTNRSGTTALGLVDTAKACGFEAKGIRCRFDDLQSVPLPGIAHVLTDGGRQHYVVVCSIGKKTMRVMDPAVGRVEKWALDRFRGCWTNVFLILSPSLDFVPSVQKQGPWSRLVSLLRPQKAVLFQAIVGAILGTILSLAGAVYIQKIVDNVIVDGNRNLLRLLGFSMLAILAVRILLGYFQSVLMLRSAQKIDAGLILGYYRHLVRLPQSFFDTMRVGEITSRVRDAVAVRDFLNGTILNLVLNPLILISALGAMFAYSWKLALLSLALIPANLVIYLISDWLNRRYQREIMERSADFDSQLVESLHAMSVVRSCGMEEQMSFRSETRLVRLLKRVWSVANAGFLLGGAGGFVTQAYTIGLLWIGADLVLNSQLTPGELMSCNALAGYITGPIVALIGMNASIRTATTATERLYEILDLEREKDEGAADLALVHPFDLKLERLNFRYPGRVATLKDVSLRLTSGTITALVGKSGCGKSTILALLQRHYLAESGSILIGGVDLQYVKLAALRRQIGYVPQKIDLLAGTVLENIAPNETQPDMPRIIELCRRVGIIDFVESLPRGFQTLITENGANLSGGQKQRLAIVRAFYLDAPVVLMDEPSSALDAESEDMLMTALETMREQGKLVLLAVHNRRLLSMCDNVVEMEEGRVIAVRKPETALVARAALGLSHPRVIQDARERLGMVDEDATDETRTLFQKLRDRTSGGILVGQTDANVMGVREDGTGWFLEDGACDFERVTGRLPAIYGFDIWKLNQGWAAACGFMVTKIREAHAHGGAITVVWYPENLTAGAGRQTGCTVADLLPGAEAHEVLRSRLDLIADNLGNLKDIKGGSIPIILRFWPQWNEDHFWWGRSRCTIDEYRRLYRFTVSYLRDVRRVRNFLYGYTISKSKGDPNVLFEHYPGDDWVDVIGLDWFGGESTEDRQALLSQVRLVAAQAKTRGRIAAITQLGFFTSDGRKGLAHCPDENWFCSGLFSPLLNDPVARNLSFVCFWRNKGSVCEVPLPNSLHASCFVSLVEEPLLKFGPSREEADGHVSVNETIQVS